MVSRPRIAVIGAGPGGLTLARILHCAGIASRRSSRRRRMLERPQGGTLDLHADDGQLRAEARAGSRPNSAALPATRTRAAGSATSTVRCCSPTTMPPTVTGPRWTAPRSGNPACVAARRRRPLGPRVARGASKATARSRSSSRTRPRARSISWSELTAPGRACVRFIGLRAAIYRHHFHRVRHRRCGRTPPGARSAGQPRQARRRGRRPRPDRDTQRQRSSPRLRHFSASRAIGLRGPSISPRPQRSARG